MTANDEHRRIFTETLQKKVGDEDVERSQFLTERKYEEKFATGESPVINCCTKMWCASVGDAITWLKREVVPACLAWELHSDYDNLS